MNKMKWFLTSQSITLFGSGLVFPFYILFIRDVGANFTEFGIAYALFAFTSAIVHGLVGRWSDKLGRKIFLLLNSWGTALVLLLFPIVTTMLQVYGLQIILGIFGAMHKTSEKALLADFTDGERRGRDIGVYHGWVSLFAALAIVVGGYLIDLFTLSIIFYIGSAILFISGFAILKINE